MATHSGVLAWRIPGTGEPGGLLSVGSHRVRHDWSSSSSIRTFEGKVTSLLLNTLSRFVIAFLPSSKHLLILWLQSPSTVILELKKITLVTISIVSPSTCHEVMGPDAMILDFWMLSFKPAFSLSSFTLSKRLLSSSSLSAIRVVLSAYLRLLFLLPVLIAAYDSSSLAFHIMYSACRLNQQGDSIQPCPTPFQFWTSLLVVPCPFCSFLTCI